MTNRTADETSTTAEVTAETTAAPALTEVEQAVENERRRIIDLVVRRARSNGYCHETNVILAEVFPDRAEYGVFFDSGGYDCNGNSRDQHRQAEEERRAEMQRIEERRRQRELERTRCVICGEQHH